MLNSKYEPGSIESLKAGIVWRDKLDYGATIRNFLSIWIAIQFILQLFSHPGFLIGFGCIYALLLGIKAGGNEVSDGAEEFSFSLAAPKSLRYKVKYIYGLKPLLIILLISLLTIYFNLSQVIWGLLVESGLNSPYSEKKAELFWYLLSFLIPICLYTTIFSTSICTYRRNDLNRAVVVGLSVTGLTVIPIANLYNNSGALVSNILTILILGLVIAISIWLSFKNYCFKEGMSVSRTNEGSASRIVIVILVAILLFYLFLVLFYNLPVNRSESINQPEKVKTC